MRKTLFLCFLLPSFAHAGNLISSMTWTESGDYKMAREDHVPFYGSYCSSCTTSRIWDGTTINLFGAKGELLTWVTYLIGGNSDATNVMVTLSSFTGTGTALGSGFSAVAVSSSNVWDYTTRPYSLYKYGYVQVLGKTEVGAAWDLSEYDEQQFPLRMQVPYVVNGNNDGIPTAPVLWTNRHASNQFYPDPAVPIEEFSSSSFTVSASSSQAIGGEVYISTDLPAGIYISTLTVYEGAAVSTTIPISLLVYNVTLPARPTIPMITVLDYFDIDARFYGNRFPNDENVDPYLTGHLRATAFLHRHKIMVQGDPFISGRYYPSLDYQKHQDGSAFKEAYGLAPKTGPGYGVGDKIYWADVYGNAFGAGKISTSTLTGTTGYCTYVSSELANCQNQGLTCSLYTADDEASQSILHTKDNVLAGYNNTNANCLVNGSTLPYLQTGSLETVASTAPNINQVLSTFWLSPSSQTYQTLNTLYNTQSSHTAGGYNSNLGVDSIDALEEDGLGPREVMWGAWKTKMPWWFLWEINYWSDVNNCPQTNNGFNPLGAQCDNDNFNIAKNFGFDIYPTTDAAKGHDGFNFSNKAGLMIYPGTDTISTPSYGFNGVMGSWRLNQFTRGIQDVDIINAAYTVNPSSTTNLVNQQVRDVMYYRPCFNSADCSYSLGPRPWNEVADSWEKTREALLQIAVGPSPGPSFKIQGLCTFSGTATVK